VVKYAAEKEDLIAHIPALRYAIKENVSLAISKEQLQLANAENLKE
jgi:hypothetical protein